MSILLDRGTKVIVQGITGTQARVDSRVCRDYGTNIVAGVTPGRGGQDVEGTPVYNTVREAVVRHGAALTVHLNDDFTDLASLDHHFRVRVPAMNRASGGVVWSV